MVRDVSHISAAVFSKKITPKIGFLYSFYLFFFFFFRGGVLVCIKPLVVVQTKEEGEGGVSSSRSMSVEGEH